MIQINMNKKPLRAGAGYCCVTIYYNPYNLLQFENFYMFRPVFRILFGNKNLYFIAFNIIVLNIMRFFLDYVKTMSVIR